MQNAKARVASGGGSAFLKASYVVSPLDGILANAPEGTEIKYSVGCYGRFAFSSMTSEMLIIGTPPQ